jgi:hypothetical protein
MKKREYSGWYSHKEGDLAHYVVNNDEIVMNKYSYKSVCRSNVISPSLRYDKPADPDDNRYCAICQMELIWPTIPKKSKETLLALTTRRIRDGLEIQQAELNERRETLDARQRDYREIDNQIRERERKLEERERKLEKKTDLVKVAEMFEVFFKSLGRSIMDASEERWRQRYGYDR